MSIAEMVVEVERLKEKHNELRRLDEAEESCAELARMLKIVEADRDRYKAALEIGKLVDKFLAWPLPESVCADLCATMHGAPHRSGTNLLTATEARQMLEYLLGGEVVPS